MIGKVGRMKLRDQLSNSEIGRQPVCQGHPAQTGARLRTLGKHLSLELWTVFTAPPLALLMSSTAHCLHDPFFVETMPNELSTQDGVRQTHAPMRKNFGMVFAIYQDQ